MIENKEKKDWRIGRLVNAEFYITLHNKREKRFLTNAKVIDANHHHITLLDAKTNDIYEIPWEDNPRIKYHGGDESG